MGYVVEISKAAAKNLKKLPTNAVDRVIPIIDALSDNPRPDGFKKLVKSKMYRIRVGDYRIIYDVFDKILKVIILKVGHRKNIY